MYAKVYNNRVFMLFTVLFTCLPVYLIDPQNKLQVEPKRGQWDMRHKQFHQGVEIHTWAILLFTEEKTCDFDSLRWAGQGWGKVCLTLDYSGPIAVPISSGLG